MHNIHAAIALFGEAEKGRFHSLTRVASLEQLNELFGHPTEDSQGLLFAIQFLLYNYEVIYLRIEEEGFDRNNYLEGIQLLHESRKDLNLAAICMPGVGDPDILSECSSVCQHYQAYLIMTEKDLYDYCTSFQA